MVVTDLDGTLTRSNGSLNQKDLETLKELKEKKVIRVIATGRNLYSAVKFLRADMPIDYLIFSCGAGILDWNTGEILMARHMKATEIARVHSLFVSHGLDFMIHHSIPDNHRFFYLGTGRINPDFTERWKRAGEFAIPLTSGYPNLVEATQFLVVAMKDEGESILRQIRRSLEPDFSVLRTTSPLDHKSYWIEIYAKGVCKAEAVAQLAQKARLRREQILGIGNDYVDMDLLDWVGHPFLVSNAATDLKTKYPIVASNDGAGFSEAVSRFLKTILLKT